MQPCLLERSNVGIINVSALFREIREQGYRGSRGTVADYLAPFRAVGGWGMVRINRSSVIWLTAARR